MCRFSGRTTRGFIQHGTALALALAVSSVGALTRAATFFSPDEGQVNFFKHSAPPDDSYTTNPSPAAVTFMNTHWARLLTYWGYWNAGNKLAWYGNAWAYLDSYAIYSDPANSVHAQLISQHPDWILHDSAGNRLYINYACAGGICPQYAANITNAGGYRSWWIGQAQGLFTQSPPFRGIFIDDVNLDLSRVSDGNGNPVTPIDPNTGGLMTNSAWRSYFADFMEQVRAELPPVEIVHNSLWFLDWNDPSVQREIRAADWINLERGVNDRGLTGGSGFWSLSRLLQFLDNIHANGKAFILDGEDPDSASDSAREYSVAAYLLASTGRDLVGDTSQTPASWWTGFDTDLGAAQGARYLWNGLWRRDFAGGMALLNPPGGTALVITLPAAYIRSDGSIVNSLALRTGEGAVLRALPAIASISPNSAAVGGPAFTLTVNGSNFVNGASVQWGTTVLATSYESSTRLTASVPAALIAIIGTAHLTVSTGAGTSAPAVFVINAPPPTGTARFLKLDTVTQGDWSTAYGVDGYNVIGDVAAYPAYVTVTPAGNTNWTWLAATADVRALRRPSSLNNRTAAAWYNTSAMNIDLVFHDAAVHQLAAYALDWDSNARAETISILDAAGAVLDSRTINAFHNGQYLVWELSGHVQIRVTNNGGSNAVLSGLFLGGPRPSAVFAQIDSATRGNWRGHYGADGYHILGTAPAYPGYATVTTSGDSNWTWAGTTGDVRALSQPPSAAGRIAACWYSRTAFTVDLAFSDTQFHQVALYVLDWDYGSRAETISLLDSSGAVLDTQNVSGFQNGRYLIWQVSGPVRIQVSRTAGSNGVLSGLFFD